MRLDKAIKYVRAKANEQKYYASFERGKHIPYCKKCAEEYGQLADWLEELKEYKENKHRSLRYMYEKGYNKGIDETCNYICHEWSLDRINTCEDFDKISQQLKAGGINDN